MMQSLTMMAPLRNHQLANELAASGVVGSSSGGANAPLVNETADRLNKAAAAAATPDVVAVAGARYREPDSGISSAISSATRPWSSGVHPTTNVVYNESYDQHDLMTAAPHRDQVGVEAYNATSVTSQEQDV